MRIRDPLLRAGALAALLCTLSACGPTMPPFSAGTVAAGQALKNDVDTELAKGGEPFAQHATEVAALETRLSGAATDAAATPNNENVAAQWRTMADPAQGLAGGLFAGLVGTAVLEIHCPNLDAWHILIAHLGVLILFTALAVAAGLVLDNGAAAVEKAKLIWRRP